ncbi:beta-ketoacyl-[acyl-carrier-protein] synthase family protein [Tuwongella immobilis]|uniref:3-oxoacyl-[acyl-carrier-protein] synthase 2 n=1 Tax=Tuwongella immobilis TaxID=692036 RepID=A0A6C2YJ88_9BACT|nr:beta-ketoacyl-[acyl-carrier-protein] synthase family protein [Tuwongella immobilis]VIP01466.1 3-oxoacyl-acp synthase : 3-oxoacyl-(Acyl-carrier-protein) synthase OS=Singulisphaera acidiphila (strain ATCC BAA-1392 / DSM 18658 / VKM B-2454 / MOB10) GN=Sinac_1387 PE=3 SV=1: ketoacyl-synt: Ketoacyl-synt_C [Tuwongella immobilis]VTR98490.1 3-oxoacyl-acp synthase : 3-oxoacyl-(Acyl-carrier-protein) synthase OS=Singulisphaera acidiphila (strain ATCC BAA-1392 / DSM 18658 / VKM B-2454 / MOB10) GN=Sinac_13
MRRVAVTGLGVVAANGIGKDAFWSACVNGVSGVGPISEFDASSFPIRVAGEVRGFDVTQHLPTNSRKSAKIMGRAAKFGVGAAGMALADSGLNLATIDPETVGVVIGTGVIPVDVGELMPILTQVVDDKGQFDLSRLEQPNTGSPLPPMWILKHLPNMVAAHISMAFNLQGPNNTITTACVAGTQAVGEAFRMIARGECDVALAGGSDSRLDPLMLMAYTALGALSRAERNPSEISRPFDRLRDGFVLGEGAGMLVLEEWEQAVSRGATIYAEVLGFGSSFDAFSITKPDPEGRGGARAITAALKEAKLNRDDIDYINAHGTSTRLNDQMETAAVKRALGDDAHTIPLSSIKSMIGHSIGAAGAIEAVAMALTLRDKVVPPTINLTHPDPNCDLDYTPNTARDTRAKVALSNSFGFGGQNGALIMRSV